MSRKSHETRRFSPHEIRDFAARIRYLASQMDIVSQSLEKLGVESIDLSGSPTAERGVGYVHGWLNSMRSSLDSLAMQVEKDK